MTQKTEKAYPSREADTEESLAPNSSLSKMLEFVGRDKRVLDVGCASGYLARLMTARGCTVVGIDASSEAIQAAAPFCTQTIVADLDVESLQNLLPNQEFDVAVFGDVLEHLREPWNVLDDARKLLSYRGYAVVSVPNIAHGAVRLGLLSGQFDYSEFGILDDTHLRFFTRRTLDQLFIRSGYRIERFERTILPLFEESDLVPAIEEGQFDSATIARVRLDPEAETLQFVVLAQALTDQDYMAQLKRQYAIAAGNSQALTGTRRILEAADSELKRTQTAYSELQLAYAELQARATELVAEYDRLTKQCLELEQTRVEGHDRLTKQCLELEQARSDQITRLEALDRELSVARQTEAAGTLEREKLMREIREAAERLAALDEVAATAETWQLKAQSREVDIDALAAELSSLHLALGAANAELAAMKQSRSWRVTSPLRALTGALHRAD